MDKIICPVMGDECARMKAIELEKTWSDLIQYVETDVEKNRKNWESEINDPELKGYYYGRYNEASIILAFIMERS